jgi:hypothetical protein
MEDQKHLIIFKTTSQDWLSWGEKVQKQIISQVFNHLVDKVDFLVSKDNQWVFCYLSFSKKEVDWNSFANARIVGKQKYNDQKSSS